MIVVKNIHEIPEAIPSVITIGTFDGVHLGHQQILSEVNRIARLNFYRSVLITFDPHPREVLGSDGQPLFLLTTIEERIKYLEKENIDLCIVIPFTRTLSLLSANEFFEQVIMNKAGAHCVVVGFDHKFGKARGADAAELERIASQHHVQSTIVPACTIHGSKISSTEIRKALYEGNIQLADQMLGRSYSLQGIVQRGEGLGRKIGFPTANVHIDSHKKIIPKKGVYTVKVNLANEHFLGIMNIGTRPTVSTQTSISVEVHILDFDRDIYGDTLEVEIISRLRDEQKFSSIDQLIENIKHDEKIARSYFSSIELKATK